VSSVARALKSGSEGVFGSSSAITPGGLVQWRVSKLGRPPAP
jgi:hypothetical protein